MISKLLHKIFGDQSERAVRPLWQRLEQEINPISKELTEISNDELRGRIDTIRDRIRSGAQQPSHLYIAVLRCGYGRGLYQSCHAIHRWKSLSTPC